MTFARYAVAAVVSAALLAGPALADPAETMKAAGKDAKWLLIQTAESAQFDGKTLTLKAVSPSVIMFTDRPARMADTIPTATFLRSWDTGGANSFRSKPPNAAITCVVGGKLRTATVELSEPKLDGTVLRYSIVKVIGGSLPEKGEETSIFFDDIPWNPGGF